MIKESSKMRRYRQWIADIRKDCDRLEKNRDSFKDELWSISSFV